MKLLPIVLVLVCLTLANCADVYKQRFLEQYNKIHNKDNGHFSKEGIPYKAIETISVEACDYGHETTSEGYSFYIWLEAMNGAISGNFSSFNAAWKSMEDYIIPSHASQPNTDLYNPKKPGSYAPTLDTPDQWPISQDPSVPVGEDPLFQELQDTYGTSDVYATHWLLDVDNVYGFGDSQGICSGGPSVKKPSFLTIGGRGMSESMWNVIPSGTCEAFKYGSDTGFSGIYSKDKTVPNWSYNVAPDAEARAIQGAFWASRWATEKGKLSQIEDTLAKASIFGDYLRYALFEKYFKRVGNCVDPYKCPGGHGRESAHYLLSWHFGWGASISPNNGSAWRLADSNVHYGYQNPLAAYALSKEPTLIPKSPTAAHDWAISLERQLELYKYVQSVEGAFGGGVVNSWNDRYDTPPAEISSNTFHGMFYDWHPAGHDPPSTSWFGMQPWSADRLAQYYYVTGDSKAKETLDKWVSWIISETTFEGDNYKIPILLEWSGVPPDVHVKVTYYGSQIGPAAATARTLSYYAAKSKNATAKQVAKRILDGMWKLYQTELGVSLEEQLYDYYHFLDNVPVPPGWSGVYPNGDVLNASSTFLSIRSFYKRDPQWYKIEEYLNGGPVPVFRYHRFTDQSDVALAMGAYGLLFDE